MIFNVSINIITPYINTVDVKKIRHQFLIISRAQKYCDLLYCIKVTAVSTVVFSYIFIRRYAYTKLLLGLYLRQAFRVVLYHSPNYSYRYKYYASILIFSEIFSFPYPSLSNALKHASMSKVFGVLYWSNQSSPAVTSQVRPFPSTIFGCVTRPHMREDTAYISPNHLTNTSVPPILRK